ncbi:pyridoxal phosphate-dependent aminotransferase [Methylovirgula sp. 4M-Z18]|uniref:pyridoxal phosphate-dependent aminotransferase n=1 Tax=Methylovirgula sp. 4M-Z18 TaxID=2293567 RepID=UPI001FDF0CC6|nr:pyridoxal phosphate-dependent aminotransferase [Methylovirgula sp. 4M-Z18]
MGAAAIITDSSFLSAARAEALAAPESGIVEVYNYGRGRQGLIPLWVGEGDLPTPAFISEAATRSLAAGETFYTYQRGIPELRAAIAAYMSRVYGPLHGAPFAPERFFVTTGGMLALQIAIRIVAGNGDSVLVPTPAWPNFAGAILTAGAVPVDVPMTLTAGETPRWHLDLEVLEAAITPNTKAMVINTPSNPTGWTATREELVALLDLARRHGLWIIADEIYGRLVYDGDRAPSFHDLIDEHDRVMFVQTMSKNWAMTGWRIGWLEAPPVLGQVIENLIQYSVSGLPVFIQRAAVAALERGEGFIAHQIARMTENRDVLCDALAATGRARFARPEGAFYLFCAIDGEPDTRKLALRLIDEALVGVAPGSAFGTGGEEYLRICLARKPDDTAEAARRLRVWLGG